jgi:hypothetical protein
MLARAEEAIPGMTSARVLLANAIDYAGLFPPAGLAMREAVENYERYRRGGECGLLGRFVVAAAQADETGLPRERLSVLASLSGVTGPGCYEVKGAPSGLPIAAGAIVYFECGLEQLGAVKRSGGRAKIRTGGVTVELIPSPEQVCAFLLECSRLRLAFKATAGLHHAIRSEYPLTYEPGSACATMHGFLNLLIASALAWHGSGEAVVGGVLEEGDRDAFRFDEDGAGWREHWLSFNELATARAEFITGFGSCSFEEPVAEMKTMGLL